MSKVPCLDFTERKRKGKGNQSSIWYKGIGFNSSISNILFGFMVRIPIDTKALGLIHPSIIFRLHLWFLFLVTSSYLDGTNDFIQQVAIFSSIHTNSKDPWYPIFPLGWEEGKWARPLFYFSLPIWPHFFHFYSSFVSSLINNPTPFSLAFSRTYQLCSFQDKNLKNESRSQQQLKDNSS